MSEPKKKRVLLADADQTLLRTFAAALQQGGFDVLLARDGSKALEASILKTPDIIVIQRDCPLIDARRFAAILRSNPRTEHTPLLVLTTEPSMLSPRLLDGEIRKPVDIDEAVAAVASAARKLEASRTLRGGDVPLSGDISALPLGDVLELLSAHKKSGVLTLSGDFGEGEIRLSAGLPVGANIAGTRARKALFRLLALSAAHFSFKPEAITAGDPLTADVHALVREARAQIEEWHKLRAELPPDDTWLERTPTPIPDVDVLPVARELLAALSEPVTVANLLAGASASDFDAAQALQHLLDAHFVKVREHKQSAPRFKQTAVLPEQLVAVLRAHVHRLPPGTVSLRQPRVLVAADDPRRLHSLSEGLSDIVEFHRETRGVARFGYGQLGAMTLADDFAVELVSLPMRRDLLPLALPLAQGAIGIICLLGGAEDAGSVADFKEAVVHKLGVPWLEVTTSGESQEPAEARVVRGMLAALCRALV